MTIICEQGKKAMTEDNSNLIRDIDAAMLAARRSRDLPPRDQIAARSRDVRAHQAARGAFAALNDWRATEFSCYNLGLLGRVAHSWSLYHSRDHVLLDHAIWFRQGRRYVAAVGQPYLSAVDIADERARLAARGLVLHVPPDPFASFHYPGWTLFIVITLPGAAVRWLPEQDGRLNEFWRNWEKGTADYRAAAATALQAAAS
jgi:hypothetical protein